LWSNKKDIQEKRDSHEKGGTGMKFGLMYEIQIPEPHYPGIEQDTYKQVIAQVMLAEEMGFEHFWTVEHHFLTEFSYCPAPEVLYGAISQRTSTIRIGHAVALLPAQYNHPIRVAERAAVLDILSDGRMDLGTGRSTTLIEMGGFEINPEETKAMWEEAIAMIPRMWTEETFSHEGHYFKVPPRSVIPKPVQKPHPPLWVACAQPDSFANAGRKGIGALCFHWRSRGIAPAGGNLSAGYPRGRAGRGVYQQQRRRAEYCALRRDRQTGPRGRWPGRRVVSEQVGPAVSAVARAGGEGARLV
jgi:alkanesulfonate monooxygenase SsuD/methylene tetrahydromethanopterin reductase-like flavin-dependent oxidoreductase (luciferase family)